MENWGLRASHLIKLTQSQAPDQGRVCVLDHHTVLHCKAEMHSVPSPALSVQRYQCPERRWLSSLFIRRAPSVFSIFSKSTCPPYRLLQK